MTAAGRPSSQMPNTRDIEQRLAVLERIVTERNHSLSREIDALALDRPRASEIAQ
jgi:hypothetical protein